MNEGGQIIRTVFGTSHKEAETISMRATKGNLEFTSPDEVRFHGKDGGKKFGDFEKKKEDKPLKVTKVEGPFDENGKKVSVVKKGEYYTYKATPSYQPSKAEVKLMKWAIKYDNGSIKEFAGFNAYNKLIDGKICVNIQTNQDFEKAKVYAYFKKVSEKICVEIKMKGNIFFYFYTSGNKRGDEMFKAAAITRKKDLEESNNIKKNDKIFFSSFQDLFSLKDIIESSSKEYLVKEINIWSHAAPDGPTGTLPTSSFALDSKQMTLEGWSKININWSIESEVNFFGCKTAISSKTFAKKISLLENFKDSFISGQTNSAYPSQYTNYRVNSENGEDNFINSEINNITSFQVTYMVAGIGRSDDWNLDEQNIALPMHKFKFGKSYGTHFQKGKKK